jgi:hypothetical protein
VVAHALHKHSLRVLLGPQLPHSWVLLLTLPAGLCLWHHRLPRLLLCWLGAALLLHLLLIGCV